MYMQCKLFEYQQDSTDIHSVIAEVAKMIIMSEKEHFLPPKHHSIDFL